MRARLVHHLGVERQRQARRLVSVVRENAAELRRRLKQARRKVDFVVVRFAKVKFDLEHGGDGQFEDGPLHAVSVALRLCKELAAVPRLGSSNLHAYRLEVKRLRYLLEMADAGGGKQKPFLQKLKEVQDTIGEWHDWVELSSLAHDVLRHDRGCKTLHKIVETEHRKYREALRVTERMRHRYLLPSRRKAREKRSKQSEVPTPVLVATAEIAA